MAVFRGCAATWPIPPTGAPGAAEAMIAGGNKMPISAPPGGTAPRPVPGRHLTLIHLHPARVAPDDHGSVAGPDRTSRRQVHDGAIARLRPPRHDRRRYR